ncbi:hypothetical protein D3C83_239910 [compost metagenome]
MLETGSATSLVRIWETVFPTSRRRAWPAVPVTTTSSRARTSSSRVMLNWVGCPAATVISCVPAR